MTSIFPDRPGPISQHDQKDNRFSPEQTKQLKTITNWYLKQHRLMSSLENRRATSHVILACIAEGNEDLYGETSITYATNLFLAFKKGYASRSSLIDRVKSETAALTTEGRFIGALAIPQELVISSLSELRQVAVVPVLTNCRKIVTETERKRPTFNKLVEFAVEEVDKQIPGSRDIKLTPSQQAGIVRQLLFTWVTQGQTSLLTNTADFITGKKTYLDNFTKDHILIEFAKITGIDSIKGVKFLEQIAIQISDYLEKVPDRLTGSPVESDDAFRNLSSIFLITNPFYKTPALALDPHSPKPNIWEDDYSLTIGIGSTSYRIPNPQTLRLVAQRQFAFIPERFNELQTGADSLNRFLRKLSEQDPIVPDLHIQINRRQQTLTEFRQQISRGEIPQELSITSEEARKLAEQQIGLMDDERQIFPLIKRYWQENINLASRLLVRYIYGDPTASDEEFRTIEKLVLSPMLIRKRVTSFMMDRISRRIQSLEGLAASKNFLGAIASIIDQDNSKAKFSESLGITVLDVLRMRDFQFLSHYGLRPLLDKLDLPDAWMLISQAEEIVSRPGSSRQAASGLFTGDSLLFEKNKGEILTDYNHPLTKHLHALLQAQSMLGLDSQFLDSPLVVRYIKRWAAVFSTSAANTLTSWTLTEKIANPITDREIIEDPKTRQSLRASLTQPYGPAQVMLTTLARLAPPETWPDFRTGLEDSAHKRYPEIAFTPEDPLPWSTQNKTGKHNLTVKFKDMIAQTGLSIDDDQFYLLTPPSAIKDLVVSATYIKRFFSIEAEVISWFDSQMVRLEQQMRQTTHHFSMSPEESDSRQRTERDTLQAKLDRIERRKAAILQSFILSLQREGLIYPTTVGDTIFR